MSSIRQEAVISLPSSGLITLFKDPRRRLSGAYDEPESKFGLLLSCTPLPGYMSLEHHSRTITLPENSAQLANLSEGPAFQ